MESLLSGMFSDDSVNQANDDSELSCFRCYDVRNAAINHNQRNRHDDTGGI